LLVLKVTCSYYTLTVTSCLQLL